MLIDGKAIAKSIYADIAERVARLPFKPVFCDVLVGNDPASMQYVSMKAKTAERLGFSFLHADFPQPIDQAKLIFEIEKINATSNLAGLIVQLPLPSKFEKNAVLEAIDPRVDVDCLTQTNLDAFYTGSPYLVPPTPAAVVTLLDSVLTEAATKQYVVIGQGELVGRPVTHILKSRGYMVTIVDKDTPDAQSIAASADVVITATGKPGLITADWVKPEVIIIDAGTAESEGSIVGDVDSASVLPLVSYLSPVPGGVGPVTVAKLLENVVLIAESMAR